MANHSETFMQCQIEIADDSHLRINGKPIETERTPGNQQWASRYLPYSNYPTILELARAIIRDTEEFKEPINR